MFLSDWYCQKLGLMDLPGHDGKVTSDNKMISNSYQRYTSVNRNSCCHFSVIFETTSKFLIVLVRLLLGKVWVDGLTGLRQEIDFRYGFGSNIILRNLGCKQRLWCPSNEPIKFFFVSVRLILPKIGVDRFTEPRRESDVRYEFHFKPILKVLERR